MRLKFSFPLFFIIAANIGFSQEPPSSEKDIEKAYQKRITKEYIYNVYIPQDLTDAFVQLNKLIDKESKKNFKEVNEGVAVKKLHFSLGRWMIYNWGFYEGSRLSHSIRQMGIYHPDEMARFIIITYHRYLNKEELKVKELIEQFAEQQEKAKEARKSRGKVIFEEKRKRQDGGK
ncbi:MAG: hypothetical protein ACI8P3_000182 [Saprospiraceae bacterium]|jgi:hypothetical protein